MEIKLEHAILRPWQFDDAESLAKYANNKNISDNLRNGFPYPYTIHDARTWLEFAVNNKDLLLAIEVNSEAVGGIGLIYKTDIYRKTAEIGYWLAQPYWNQGIMTEAIKKIVEYCFSDSKIIRIYAGIFENNKTSAHILTKAGFKLEAVHENGIIKNGVVMNELIYAILK